MFGHGLEEFQMLVKTGKMNNLPPNEMHWESRLDWRGQKAEGRKVGF